MDNLLRLNILTRYKNHNAERKTLRRVFCFCFLTLFFLLNGQTFTYAQSGSQPWPTNKVVPYFVTDSARCGTDGKVRYGFLKTNGDTIRTVEELHAIYLWDVRIYKKVNPTDSAQYAEYTGGEGVFHISVAGTYHIGLEAWSEPDGSGIHYVFDTLLTIGTSYKEPHTPVLAAYANMPDQYGYMPSFTCDSSGRIQVKIIGGRYPFQLYVWQEYGEDNYVEYSKKWGREILGPQSGQDSLKSDYWEYYSVDSLPPGRWRIQMKDSCGNAGQYAIQIVDSITPPVLDHVEVLSSGPSKTYNIVQIDVELTSTNHEYCMRRATREMTYQFYMQEKNGAGDWVTAFGENTNFRPFPESGSTKIRLRDTVANVTRACQMWGPNKRFFFSLQNRVCKDGPQDQHLAFVIYGPQEEYFKKDSTYVRDSVRAINSCHNRYYRHLEKYSIHYETYQPSHYTTVRERDVEKHEDERYRYHFTDSLTWTYKIGEHDTIFVQKVGQINTWSSLSLTDLRDMYPTGYHTSGSGVIKFDTTTVRMNVQRILTDAYGCVLYSDEVVFNYDTNTTFQKHDWRISRQSGGHCCESDNTITLEEVGIPEAEPVGTTTIKLTTSPDNNFYNFQYTYNYATGRWVDLQCDRADNTATITGGIAGRSLTIGEPCMASGRYEFVIQSGNCGASNPISINADFGEIYETVVVSEPSHIEEQDCSSLLVTYTGGEVQRIRRKNNMATQIDPCTTIIKVKGPSGGYCNTCDYHIGDHIPLSLPGTYIFKLTPYPNPDNTSDRLCDASSVFANDTIYYSGGMLLNVYAEALLCRSDDPVGNVYVKVINGKLPFTYTLYGKRNFDPSSAIDINTTGQFYDVPFNGSDTLSCIVMDACDALTTIPDIYPKTLETMQKVWFENTDSDTSYVCEGDIVSVNALHMVDFFTYDWWYLDTATSSIQHFGSTYHPNLFIHHGMPSGWYHVTIDETGCYERLQDSVYLVIDKAPSVDILPKSNTICPGKSAKFDFKLLPTDTTKGKAYYKVNDDRYDSITVNIAFVNEMGVSETREYRGAPYDIISDSIIVTSFTKVYPVGIVQDSSAGCDYDVADPDDTVYVYMKPQTAGMLCSIEAKDTLVCYGGNAVLKARKKNAGFNSYIINWYDDYSMTIPHGLPDTISGSQYAESDELQYLESRRLLFVNTVPLVGDECPAINGITNQTINLTQNGSTSLVCGDVYRFYDSGGPTGNFTANESIKHIFATNDGSRVLIHFDELDLSGSSHLYVVSGTHLTDSTILSVLKKNDPIPDYLVSNCDTMMLYFVSGVAQPTSGWSAIIQREPGIAVADVRPEIRIVYEDTVCQQSKGNCDLPISTAHKNVLSSMGKLAQAQADMAHFGPKTYIYPGISQVTGCDSIVEFRLYVTPPPLTSVTEKVVTNLALPYKWDKNPGAEYWESGVYEAVVSVGDCNCDSVARLYLTVLDVKISASPNDTVCEDVTNMTLHIENIEVPTSLLPQEARETAVGDVLCFLTTNPDSVFTLPPDTFILQASSIPELHAMGVVFDVDGTGTKGRAIALRNAADTTCQYASVNNANVSSQHKYNTQVDALQDVEGYQGTINLRKSAYKISPPSDNYDRFKAHAPAAFYCYYYDSDSSCYSPTATSPTGRVHKGWYLPAAGELYRYFARRDIVNETMSKLKEAVLPKVVLPYDSLPQEDTLTFYKDETHSSTMRAEVDSKYHTSTEKGNDIVYRIAYKGLVNFNHNKYINIIIPGDWIVESSINPEWGLSKNTIMHLNFQFANRQSNNIYWIYLHFARAIIQFEGNAIYQIHE